MFSFPELLLAGWLTHDLPEEAEGAQKVSQSQSLGLHEVKLVCFPGQDKEAGTRRD